jgi:rhomboid protease GluP
MRMLSSTGQSFFEVPQATVYVLVTSNVVIYCLCLYRSSAIDIPPEVLLAAGAMYSLAIERHEYWRFLTYGFLHANLLHLAANMICLILWGGLLEKRIGTFYFILLYAGALIAGGIAGAFTHSGQYLMVGASGAISGILGALLYLWVMAKIRLATSFVVINLGLNVALGLGSSKTDWAAHLDGFAAGFVLCAALDLVERMNARILRCKFPEFVKVNGLAVLCALSVYLFASGSMALIVHAESWLLLIGYAVLFVAIVMLLDFLLSIRKGLALIVVVYSSANAALVVLFAVAFLPPLIWKCTPRLFGAVSALETLVGVVCADMHTTVNVVAAIVFSLTMLVYWSELRRGINDVGFVGNSLRAERKRYRGI